MRFTLSTAVRVCVAIVGLAVSAAAAITGTGSQCCAQSVPGACGAGTIGIATDCKPGCPSGRACLAKVGCLGPQPWAYADCVLVPAGPTIP